MNHNELQIQKDNNEIPSFTLDRGKYFESLLIEIQKYNMMDEEKLSQLYNRIQLLLKEQIDKYTSHESSSVRIETAQGILASIYYTIGAKLKEATSIEEQMNLVLRMDMNELFKQGQKLLISKVESTKGMLIELQSLSMLPNIAYYDTLMKGIPEFFIEYDYKYAAQESPGSIDYPLLYDPMDITGIEYLNEYLSHLLIEHTICSQVPSGAIEKLMKVYSINYKEDLFNVCELVLTNLIGKRLLHKSLPKETEIETFVEALLSISNEERSLLEQQLQLKSKEELKQLYQNALDEVLDTFVIHDETLRRYLENGLEKIISYTKFSIENQTLHRVFLSLDEPYVTKENNSFSEVKSLEDDKLRTYIEEINKCSQLDDKINLLRKDMMSVSDFGVIINECFTLNELNYVFDNLQEVELLALNQKINHDFEYQGERYFKGSWEEKLRYYINTRWI